MIWDLIRPFLPHLALLAALGGGYWYVVGLQESVQTLETERDDALTQARVAQDAIGARLRADRVNRESELETIRRLATGRAASRDVVDRLRDYRAAVPAAAAYAGGKPDPPGDGAPTGCAPAIAVEDRSREIAEAAAEVSADLSAFKAELLRLERAMPAQ